MDKSVGAPGNSQEVLETAGNNSEQLNRRRFMRKAVLGVGALAAASFGAVKVFGDDGQATTTAATGDGPTVSTAKVKRGRLASEREFNASISHGDPWNINTAVVGTITSARARGTVVGFGEALVSVDAKTLTLAAGSQPLYRELYRVDTRYKDDAGNKQTLQTGFDVFQLQSHLLAGEYDVKGTLLADGEFGVTTEKAVKAWQKANGLTITGRIDSTQLVFEPLPVRIEQGGRVGDPFQTLQVTSARSIVSVDTSTRDRAALPVDSNVRIDLGNGEELQGNVLSQEQVTGPDGSRQWRSKIDAIGELPSNVSSAKVFASQVIASDVLLVPVTALLGLAEGGFAVETPTSDGSRLVRVTVGDVLDGQAEIEGDVAEGDTVVVPA